jgi:hypothetical protein
MQMDQGIPYRFLDMWNVLWDTWIISIKANETLLETNVDENLGFPENIS